MGFNHATGKFRNKHRGIYDNKAIFYHQIPYKILDLLLFRIYKSLQGETTENNGNQATLGFEYK